MSYKKLAVMAGVVTVLLFVSLLTTIWLGHYRCTGATSVAQYNPWVICDANDTPAFFGIDANSWGLFVTSTTLVAALYLVWCLINWSVPKNK